MKTSLGIIGAGLIGASIIDRAVAAGCSGAVSVFERSPDYRQALADRFEGIDFVDEVEGLGACDIVFVATPVSTIAGLVRRLLETGDGDGPVVVDTGSVKLPMVNALSGLPGADRYVPGHPLSGSHLSGPSAASGDIIGGRVFVLTPTPATGARALDRASAFLTALGAEVVIVDPETHDRALALTSHLPHVVAYALVEAFADMEASIGRDAVALAAKSFRAQTIYAASDPEMWADIMIANRGQLNQALDDLIARLEDHRALIERGDKDEIMRRIETARRNRQSIGD